MQYTPEEKALIWLDSFSFLDYAKKSAIAALVKPRTPFDFSLCRKKIISVAGEEARAAAEDLGRLDKLLASYRKRGISCVTYHSKLYPENLKQTDEAPLVLYCKGNTKLLKNWRMLAIVGSRRTPPGILKLTENFAKNLSDIFTVVTGIADGGDTAAIRGALESGNIISVQACGFDFVYPECNRALLAEVMKRGLAVTEYPPFVSPQKYYFPVRNRIIAGLAEGVLVVSGGLRSGTRHTARYAFNYGREVFAFPYSIGVSEGEGCNDIIKKGGNLVENLVDITAPFGINLTEKEEVSLTAAEEEVLNLLRGGEKHITELAVSLGKKTYELQPLLMMLEMKNRIADCGGNRYCAVK